MTARKPHRTEPPQEKQLRRMVVVSAVLHAALIVVLVIAASRGQSRPAAPAAYTVTLVDPAALGTNIPSGGGKVEAGRSFTGAEQAAPAPRPQPEPKPQPSTPEKKPAAVTPPQEPVKATTEAPAAQEVKKPGAKKPDTPSTPEKVVLKAEEKKPQPQKKEGQTEQEKRPAEREEKRPEPERAVSKPEPAKAPHQPAVPRTPASPSESARRAAEPSDLSTDERDRRILAALERVRKQVQEKAAGGGMEGGSANRASGSGPLTLGGAPGEGGGGVVRGLEFIMYTEQVKRRVKENWIVTEKKPGLTAVVRFGVEADGRVFDVELVKPSGDRAFDESTVRAVRSASPLPPPPQAYLHEFATQKVEVAFGGEERLN